MRRLSLLVLALMVVSLVVGPAGLSPRTALAALVQRRRRRPAIIVREIRLPRTLLAVLIGATLGLSGAALQGLFRNPLAEPALFGAPQAAAAASSFVIAFGFAVGDIAVRCRSPAFSARWFRSARWC